MKTQDRLAAKLEDTLSKKTGHPCVVDFFTIAEGFWRTSKYSQCYRWKAFIWETFPEGHRCLRTVGSYNTMTDCIKSKYEIALTEDKHPGHYEADAILKEKKP